ncbi:hypothetical protein GCM10010530_79280 [Kribbella aluminosa]
MSSAGNVRPWADSTAPINSLTRPRSTELIVPKPSPGPPALTNGSRGDLVTLAAARANGRVVGW